MVLSVLIICILHRIWAIRFFVANMLPGLFEKSGGESSPLLVFFIYIILEKQIFQVLFFCIYFHILKTLLGESWFVMKYMHFKASCSYAALAAIMELNGVDTEDYKIALEIKLPWLFSKEDGAYISGPMLQGTKWFNLWLLPRGYRMCEEMVEQEQLCSYLRAHKPAMLGIQTPYGKHAVVFAEYDGKYHFMNPTHESSGERTELSFSEEELLDSVDQETMVGMVIPAEAAPQLLTPYLKDSISVIRENCAAIEDFAAEKHDPNAYFPMMNSMFRPLLLDGITMLELAGETDLAQKFTALQQQFMAFMRGTREEALRETLSIGSLHDLTERYAHLIERQIS